jgi:hypothetical protein
MACTVGTLGSGSEGGQLKPDEHGTQRRHLHYET